MPEWTAGRALGQEGQEGFAYPQEPLHILHGLPFGFLIFSMRLLQTRKVREYSYRLEPHPTSHAIWHLHTHTEKLIFLPRDECWGSLKLLKGASRA